MKINGLDHLVITTANLEILMKFYSRVLGMTPETFADGRIALKFGQQKINLHKVGEEVEPHAQNPTPGGVDICLLTDMTIDQVMEHLSSCNVKVLAGPVIRSGATGPLTSIYIRDPDGNLIELATPTENDG